MSTDPFNIVRKLIVELNQRSDDDLTRAAAAEGDTKTTTVNRAIQVYERVRANQAAGGYVVLVDENGTHNAIRLT